MWECGLKHFGLCFSKRNWCHSLCGSVDWNIKGMSYANVERCHSLCGSVDWNQRYAFVQEPVASHSLCGSVDWNTDCLSQLLNTRSLLMWECGLKLHSWWSYHLCWRHSLCGSVDWNHAKSSADKAIAMSLLMWECGLKPIIADSLDLNITSLLMWECGLKQSLATY